MTTMMTLNDAKRCGLGLSLRRLTPVGGRIRCSAPRHLLVLLFSQSLFLFMFVAASANAGGLYTNEFSTTVQGNSGAGRGAWTPDASATLHYPATMTELEDHGFATGFSLAVGNIHFDTASDSPNGTGNGGNQSGLGPIASFSYAHKISDRVRFGLSFFSISGSILNPSNDWGGRFQLTELSLLTISISPTLAVRVTDWLSVGAGPVVTYGTMNWDLKAAVPPGFESNLRLKDLDDWEASGRVGILLTPHEDLSFSVFYNSKTDFKLNGEANGPAGFAPDLDLELPLAQFVEVSAYWQATDELALLATFNWEDWSEADNLGVTIGGVSTSASTGFKDTYKVAVGANYQIARDWLLQTGLSYDTSALQNKHRITALPIDEQVRFSLGFQHNWSESLNVGMSFVYINLGQGEVRTAGVRGDYQRNHAFVIGGTLAFSELPWSGKLTLSGAGS